MTSKYTTSSTGFSVAAGATIPLTNTLTQCGNCTTGVDNGIQINTSGLYRITATISGFVSGGGNINLQVYNGTNAIPTLIGQAYTNADQPDTVTVSDVIKINGNCRQIQNVPTVITMQNYGVSTNTLILASLNVEKIK